MKFFNPQENRFTNEPYMIKEHTVVQDGYAATVVVVPFARKNKKGQETGSMVFIPMGVRIEQLNTRVVNGEYVLPGYTMFVKKSTGKVSEASTYRFKVDRLGQPYMSNGQPELLNPSQKWAGIELDKHPMKDKIAKLVSLANESYAAYREAQRAAA